MKNARLKTVYFVMSAAFAVASAFVTANLPAHDTATLHSFAGSAPALPESVVANPADKTLARSTPCITGS